MILWRSKPFLFYPTDYSRSALGLFGFGSMTSASFDLKPKLGLAWLAWLGLASNPTILL